MPSAPCWRGLPQSPTSQPLWPTARVLSSAVTLKRSRHWTPPSGIARCAIPRRGLSGPTRTTTCICEGEMKAVEIKLTQDEADLLETLLTLDLGAIGFESREQTKLHSILKKLRKSK